MKCPKCGTDIPAGTMQCPGCGQKFVAAKRCPHCGNTIPASAAVCPKCNQPVGSAAPRSPFDSAPKRQSSFRWWRIPIYILVLALGFGAGSIFTRQSILNNVTSAFSQFTDSSEDSTSSKKESSSEKVVHITKPTPTPQPPAFSDSGTLGNYQVSILSARRSTDYEGNPAIIVKFSFTNNSNENKNFMWSIDYKAFQSGVQLDNAMITDDPQLNVLDASKDVQPGGTIEVEHGYLLSDDSSNVDIEVTEYLSYSKEKLIKTFILAELT